MAKPKTIPRPPSRYYDPALDSAQRAAKRGLSYLTTDTELRDRPRLLEDYNTQTGDINRQSSRGLADLVQDRTRSNENYARNLSQLQRNYTQLGNSQGQAIAASGTAMGGALAASGAKRAANQAWEKTDIDTGYQREQGDIGTAQTRLGEDTAEQRRLANQGFTRGDVDLSQILSRGTSEFGEFKKDTAGARYNQAVQAGWQPPGTGGGQPGGGRKAVASLGSQRQAAVKAAISKGAPLKPGTLKGSKLTATQKQAVRAYVKKKGKK